MPPEVDGGAGNPNPPGGDGAPINTPPAETPPVDIAQLVGKAVEDRMPRLFSGLLNRTTEVIAKTVEEKLKALTGNKGAEAGTLGPDGRPVDGKPMTDADVERANLKRQVREYEERMATLETSMQERETKETEGRKRNAVGEALETIGVIPSLRRALTAQILSEASFRVTEDGVYIINQADGMEEPVPVDEFIRAVLQTPEGEVFFPPKSSAGLPVVGGGGASSVRVTEADFDPAELAKNPKKWREMAALIAANVKSPEARGLRSLSR